MQLHKNTKLTPIQRKQIWKDHQKGASPTELARKYNTSRPTIYKIITRARKKEFIPRKSTNKRYRCFKYGFRRLEKIAEQIEKKRKKQARRYNKQYPGEMIHFDTKRLPLLKGESGTDSREYLFIAIDDFSRELYASIQKDKSQFSSIKFLEQVIEECPYTIECAYSDNGTEYKGKPDHLFVKTCLENKIAQRFTKPKTPRTNGKAERVIRTLMEMWHSKIEFKSRAQRRQELIRFVNFYNTVKTHSGIDGMTPLEKLIDYFFPSSNPADEDEKV